MYRILKEGVSMKIEERKMDLFKMPTDYTLVHCISEDCAMGAGIAKIFNVRYKNMKGFLIDTLEANKLKYPVSIFYYGGNRHNVINMITKEKYWHKPTYKTFKAALEDVVEICQNNNIKKLAMPKIGCGLDKLQWGEVKNIIEWYFKDLHIEIVVCYL